MEKSKIIEELFYSILTYSYLLLPLAFVFFRVRKMEVIVIALYGLLFFFLLNFDTDLQKKILTKRLYYSLYTFLEYFIFTFLLWSNIKEKKIRKLIIILSIFFFAFQCTYYFIAKQWKLDTIPIGVETILIFIYIFFYFFQYFRTTQNQYVYNEACFWVAVGVMIYLGGNFFFYILGNYINQEEINFWFVTYIAETLKNILLTVALFIYARKPDENTKKNLPYLDLDFSFTDQQPY
ncbi:MAG TPA: hypothetical protein VET23_13455 [Chitinophagaceae bacterium]|nr:hypothetical protein [Chitinophagaceae bacterium]